MTADDQWTAGRRLVEALGWNGQPAETPRPQQAAVLDLVARRQFARLADDVWNGIAALAMRLGDQPLTCGEYVRVLLLEWIWKEPMTAAGGRRKRRLAEGDPVLLTTVLTAFAHACLERATPAERQAMLAAIAAAAATD